MANDTRISQDSEGKYILVYPGETRPRYVRVEGMHMRMVTDHLNNVEAALKCKDDQIIKLKRALKREIQQVDDFYAEEMAALREELNEWKAIAKSVRQMLDSD